MKQKIILLALFIMCSLGSYAQNVNQAADDIMKGFFNILEQQGSDDALEYLFNLLHNAEKKKSDMETSKTKLGDIGDLNGPIHGYEEIRKKELGESYKVYHYLVKYHKQPYLFEVSLYKPEKEWKILAFDITDNLDKDLD